VAGPWPNYTAFPSFYYKTALEFRTSAYELDYRAGRNRCKAVWTHANRAGLLRPVEEVKKCYQAAADAPRSYPSQLFSGDGCAYPQYQHQPTFQQHRPLPPSGTSPSGNLVHSLSVELIDFTLFTS
jgi:hypothetical protein